MSVDTSSDAPLVPERARDDPWVLTETSSETVADLPTATVEGFTVLYEDSQLREEMRDRTGLDQPWRVFFATDLTFVPPLPPGTESLVRPGVSGAVRKSFADDLRERGLTDVELIGSERIRVDAGSRAELSTYRGKFVSDGTSHDVRAVVAVWYDDGFIVAGGIYPADGEDVYRAELTDLVRGVSSGRT